MAPETKVRGLKLQRRGGVAHRKRSTFAGLLLVQGRNCRLVRCLSAYAVMRASLHGHSQCSDTRARAWQAAGAAPWLPLPSPV